MFLIPKCQNYIFTNPHISFYFYPSPHFLFILSILLRRFSPWPSSFPPPISPIRTPIPTFPPWFPAFPPLFPAFPSLLPWFPHYHYSHPYYPHFHHDSPHSHHSSHSVPRFPIPDFTDSFTGSAIYWILCLFDMIVKKIFVYETQIQIELLESKKNKLRFFQPHWQ